MASARLPPQPILPSCGQTQRPLDLRLAAATQPGRRSSGPRGGGRSGSDIGPLSARAAASTRLPGRPPPLLSASKALLLLSTLLPQLPPTSPLPPPRCKSLLQCSAREHAKEKQTGGGKKGVPLRSSVHLLDSQPVSHHRSTHAPPADPVIHLPIHPIIPSPSGLL